MSLFFKRKHHNIERSSELKRQVDDLLQINSDFRRKWSQRVILNRCNDCLIASEEKPMVGDDVYLQDTGICDQCGKVNDVVDLELISFYRSLGLDTDFIYKFLPRLRKRQHRYLSFEDIYQELCKKTNIAEELKKIRLHILV